jgi:hypothetical protein
MRSVTATATPSIGASLSVHVILDKLLQQNQLQKSDRADNKYLDVRWQAAWKLKPSTHTALWRSK